MPQPDLDEGDLALRKKGYRRCKSTAKFSTFICGRGADRSDLQILTKGEKLVDGKKPPKKDWWELMKEEWAKEAKEEREERRRRRREENKRKRRDQQELLS